MDQLHEELKEPVEEWTSQISVPSSSILEGAYPCLPQNNMFLKLHLLCLTSLSRRLDQLRKVEHISLKTPSIKVSVGS